MPSAITSNPLPFAVAASAAGKADGHVEPLERLQRALESCPVVGNPHDALRELLACCDNRELHLSGVDASLLQNLPTQAWQALDELCGGVLTLESPYADGILEHALPALPTVNRLRLLTGSDVHLTGLERYPAWQHGRRPQVELDCTRDGLNVTVTSGTVVTGTHVGPGETLTPSIVTFVHPDGSVAESPQLLSGMEGDALACLQEELRLALDLPAEAKETDARTSELADQLVRVGLHEGEFDTRRLYKDDRRHVTWLSDAAWHALRAISLGRGHDLRKVDFGGLPGPPLRSLAPLKGLECVVTDVAGDSVFVGHWQQTLKQMALPQDPVLTLRCTGSIGEVRARAGRLQAEWAAEFFNPGMPLLLVDGKESGGVPGVPFTNHPLDGKGRIIRLGDPEYLAAATKLNENRNAAAFFKDPVTGRNLDAIVCRHLVVAWCDLRHAHLSGPHRDAPFSYDVFKDEQAIAAHVDLNETEGFGEHMAKRRLLRPFSPDQFPDLVQYLAASLDPGTHQHFYIRVGRHAVALEVRRLEDGRRSATLYDPNVTGRDFTRVFAPGDDLEDFGRHLIDPYRLGHGDLCDIGCIGVPSPAFLAMQDRFVSQADRSSPAWLSFQAFGCAVGLKGPVQDAVFSNKAHNVRSSFDRYLSQPATEEQRISDLREALAFGREWGAVECAATLMDRVLAAPPAQLSDHAKASILDIEADNARRSCAYRQLAPEFAPRQRQAFHEWGRRFAHLCAIDPSAAARAVASVENLRQVAASNAEARGYLAALYCGVLSALAPGQPPPAALRDLFSWTDRGVLIMRLAKGDENEQRWALELANSLRRGLPDYKLPLPSAVRKLFAQAYPPGRVEPSGSEFTTHRDASRARLRVAEVVFPSASNGVNQPSVRCEADQALEAFKDYLLPTPASDRDPAIGSPGARSYLLPAHLLEPAPSMVIAGR